jgi:hypothetical protein
MATRIPDTVPSNQRLGDSTLVVLCTFFANIFFSLRYMTNHFFVRSLPPAAELRLILLGARRGWKCVRETFQASLRHAQCSTLTGAESAGLFSDAPEGRKSCPLVAPRGLNAVLTHTLEAADFQISLYPSFFSRLGGGK